MTGISQGPDEKFLLKRTFLVNSAKIVLVKIIFHVLFLVLETKERRK